MLVFCHGNKVGTGSQMTVDIGDGDYDSNNVIISIYPQVNKSSPITKWEGPIFSTEGLTVFLVANDVARLISLFQGNRDEVMITNRGQQEHKEIYVDYVTSPFVGYAVHISSSHEDRPKEDMRIVLNQTEGLTILKALEAAMAKIAFDI